MDGVSVDDVSVRMLLARGIVCEYVCVREKKLVCTSTMHESRRTKSFYAISLARSYDGNICECVCFGFSECVYSIKSFSYDWNR